MADEFAGAAAASVIKVPLVTALHAEAASGHIDLAETHRRRGVALPSAFGA